MGHIIYRKMIVGHGNIASVLTDNKNMTYFACGVSNSLCEDQKEFNREKELLLKQPITNRLVYFSSLSIFYKDSPYTQHKRHMEALVMAFFPQYCIIRLGNLTFDQNENTIINYLRNAIKYDKPYKVEDTCRYVIDKEEFLHWVNLIPDFNTQMNITGERLTVKEIVERIKSGRI